MSTPYTFTRNDHGIKAETRIDLGADRRELRVTTARHSFKPVIQCRAAVVQVSPDGLSYTHAFGLAGGGDYSAVLANDPARCTEKALRAVHERCTADIAPVLAAARAHYARA